MRVNRWYGVSRCDGNHQNVRRAPASNRQTITAKPQTITAKPQTIAGGASIPARGAGMR